MALQTWIDAFVEVECDNFDWHRDHTESGRVYRQQFASRTKAQSMSDARQVGWSIGRLVLCPDCVKAKRRPKQKRKSRAKGYGDA